MAEGLPQRVVGPAVRAAVAPSSIIAAGAGTAVGILAGAPLIGIVLLAIVGIALAAGIRRLARPRGERMDPFTLSARWRAPVHGALRARRRFEHALPKAPDGPLRDRLAEIGDRIDAGVREAWLIARRGDDLEEGLRLLDVTRTTRALDGLERELDDGGADDERLGQTRDSLRAQLDSAQRLTQAIEDARSRLRLLEARLDEAVSRAVELSLRTGGEAELTGLGTDVDVLVHDLESLRIALEELDRPSGATGTA